ncbi:peptidoglycan DD-metalloendopeptidase family protein [Paracoccus kondratievae]|uniref:M23 family metallopeptidase n=1 Tax=Paracoccus TaxID=265 RepID=UPI000A0C0F61|nr:MULTISPECIES: M23 family metallopeptidase [Paracoccus]QFQ88606.1 peptidoglycan DD-metalloendopeptidase family protein [Paracoccus kondratievae]SMG45079.1 Murein DD-endopeptidase MepM and murein hydrolase activator NlpD, contain LysM domain [Paracoccus sp. J56]
MRITRRLNSVLERWLPEQRLFLKSDKSTRFLRLRPATQLAAIGGITLVFGWSIVASSILVIDAIAPSGARNGAVHSQSTLEARLTDLSAERDRRAAEAVAAQNRFAVALDQVSRMQSLLLESEAQRRELETGLDAVHASLQQAVKASREANAANSEAAPVRTAELQAALDILAGELEQAANARADAVQQAEDARRVADALALERDQIVARNDQILSQLEDAVSVSVKPLDDMFRSVGMNPDEVLRKVRQGYSGQGGPLNPVSYSSSGNAAITQGEAKANEILITLDQMNSYRIAVEKMPLAMPVKSAFRYTSPFGRRWGRSHEGIDMAAPVGTPVYATGEGTVIFAGWQRGYGNLIKIQHELGTETRFGHLSKIRVKVGQKVSRGSLIGDMGNTGRSTGSHLHYEVRVNGRAVDPMRFIKAAQNVF